MAEDIFQRDEILIHPVEGELVAILLSGELWGVEYFNPQVSVLILSHDHWVRVYNIDACMQWSAGTSYKIMATLAKSEEKHVTHGGRIL